MSDHMDLGACSGDPGDVGSAMVLMMLRRPSDVTAAAEPYVEPDYALVWSQRWIWIRAALMAVAGCIVVWLVWRNAA